MPGEALYLKGTELSCVISEVQQSSYLLDDDQVGGKIYDLRRLLSGALLSGAIYFAGPFKYSRRELEVFSCKLKWTMML